MSTDEREPAVPDDAIGMLLGQHDEIRRVFDEVDKTTGTDRWEVFGRLMGVMVVHEVAEEMVVHPRLRAAADGTELIDDLLEEEGRIKYLLAEIESAGPDDPNFDALLLDLREATLRHLGLEEREAFPVLRARLDTDELTEMERALRAVESVIPFDPAAAPAPGRPAGPIAAAVERVKAAIRRAAAG